MLRLKYLFGVHFKDGSEYFQTPEDVSITDPKRSAFYDVARRLEDVELFQLQGEDGATYLLDLRDGHFEINRAPFFVSEPPPPGSPPLRLIYFRRVRRHFTMGDSGPEECAVEVEYHFGWQTTLPDQEGMPGRNIKQGLVLL